MAITTATIQKRIKSAGRWEKDDAARSMVNTATAAELQGLDAEAVLRLYQALALMGPRVYSSADAAALKRLATHSQFQPIKKTPEYGVDLVKNASRSHANVQSQLTAGLVTRIYAAEKKRLDWFERHGVDGSTVGRGQLGQAAYLDVKKPTNYQAAFEVCLTRHYLARLLSQHAGIPQTNANTYFDFTRYKVRIPTHYSFHVYAPLEDFVVAGYLAIKIRNATKKGRSAKDTARFAVAVYHGMWNMVVAAQTAVKDDIHWAPVEAQLLKQGYSDQVAYVNEVVT